MLQPQVWYSTVSCQEHPDSLGPGVCSSIGADIFLRDALCKDTCANTPSQTAPGQVTWTSSCPLSSLSTRGISQPFLPGSLIMANQGEAHVKMTEVCALPFHSYVSSPQAHRSCRRKPILCSLSPHGLPEAELRCRVERSSLTSSPHLGQSPCTQVTWTSWRGGPV